MEDYKYIAKNYNTGFFVRIHNYFAGLFARRDLLKEFCTNNGIEYKPQRGKKHVLPASYVFFHGELKYLGNIRDKALLSYYEEYMNDQLALERIIHQNKSDLELEKNILEHNTGTHVSIQNRLKNEQDPLRRITLQHQREMAKTKIENNKIRISELKQNIEDAEKIQDANRKNWLKQVAIIDGAFDIRRDRFSRNASKHIRKYLNYTDVHPEIIDHNDSVKGILKGEINEKQR